MMRKKPMLAYPVSKKEIDYSEPVFMQPKLDGVRCVIQCELHYLLDNQQMHENTVIPVITAYSRTGKEWKNIQHILAELRPFFQKYPNHILDGELYNHDFKDDFEKIISMVRKTKPTDEARLESAENVQFHCYDIIDEKLPFDQRIEFVNESLMLMGDSIDITLTMQVYSDSEAKKIHDINLHNG